MLFAARTEVCTDLLVNPLDLVERGGAGDDHMRCDKTLGTGDLERPGNQKCLTAPIFAPDKLEIPPALGHVVQLPADHAFFDIEPNCNTFQPACRNRAPA